MAWTRLVQTGFESGSFGETPFSDATLTPPNGFPTTSPITGDRSFYQTGRGGFGYMIEPEVTEVQMSFMFNSEGTGENIPFIQVYCRESGGWGRLYVTWDMPGGQMNMYYIDQNDSVVDTVSVPCWGVNGFNSERETTVAVALVMKVGASGWASFYVNGEQILNFNASVFGMQQATGVFAVKIGDTDLGGIGTYGVSMDDWYVETGSGNSDDVPRNYRYDVIKPVADGTWSDWTPTAVGSNYEVVDEYPPDDVEDNYASFNGDEDVYDMSAFSQEPDSSIISVIPMVRAKAGRYPQLYIRLISRNVGDDPGSNQDILVGYRFFWERYTLDPSSSPWTEAAVNSGEFGYELRT